MMRRKRPRGLPTGVPDRRLWVALGAEPQNTIRALHDAFVRPLDSPGIISIDQADFDAALSFGGEVKVYSASGANAGSCARALIDILRQRRPSQKEGMVAACCVRMRLPLVAGMADVDQIVQTIDGSNLFDERTLVLLSAHQEDRADVLVRLVTIQGHG